MTETPSPAPNEFLDRLEHYRQFLGAAEIARLVEALERPRLPAIRVNTLKIGVEEARRTWPEWYGWTVQPVPFCAAGWQVLAQDQPLGHTLEYDMGFYYIQDAASMLPVEMFGDDDAPLILDMAAAPGGKTTHLASRFGDRAVIVANDTSASRITGLRSNLQTWGVMGALVTSYPGERFGRWFPETFDKVLLDAPCSGDTLRVTTGRRTRTVSDRERQALCQRQGALLLSAFQAVRPGGEIVYSTCTMAPEEDEAVLDELLRAYPHQAVIETVDHLPEPVCAPGLPSDGTRRFDPGVRRAIRLWPHLYQTSGFFAARIRKTGSIPVRPDTPPARPWAKTGLAPLAHGDQARLIADLHQGYGFDLEAVMEARSLALWARDGLVHAIPERLAAQFPDLPHAAAGFMIGQQASGQFVPSHELITRFAAGFASRRVPLSDEQAALWREGRDLRDMPGLPYPPGSIVLLEDSRGRFLGRGKVLRDRVRNLLPRRLTR
jgi:16S rRNA (cytosine1407-C5)-methyltransferase